MQVQRFEDCSGEDFPYRAPDNAKGLVVRTLRATDGSGNMETAVQLIWIVDYVPFYIADTDCSNADPNDGVIWPCDVELTACPDSAGVTYPVLFDDQCSMVSGTYRDEEFHFVDGACRKILREWIAVDWCQ